MDGLEDRERFLSHLAEDNVLAVQPGGSIEAEEELGSVGVGASVSHGEDAGSGVLFLEVLVSEFVSVDGLTTSAVSGSEIAALAHEARDDSVESAALVKKRLARLSFALFASAESTEVL